MKSSTALSIVAGGILLLSGVVSAGAADYSLRHGAPASRMNALPFPRSARAQAVWASDACWADCGSHCAWGLVACLKEDGQGHCLKATNSCDRYCQRECRTYGGPLLNIFD